MLSVLGDGNGSIWLIDLLKIRRYIVEWVEPVTGESEILFGVYKFSLDLNRDGSISLIDNIKMRKKLFG